MKTDYLPMAVCQLELELVLATEVLVPHKRFHTEYGIEYKIQIQAGSASDCQLAHGGSEYSS
jgi:hypothetical protein